MRPDRNKTSDGEKDGAGDDPRDASEMGRLSTRNSVYIVLYGHGIPWSSAAQPPTASEFRAKFRLINMKL